MNANARLTDPLTSHEAAASINVHSPEVDKDAPSKEVLSSVLIVARLLTKDFGDFTDSELRARALPHARLIHKVTLKDDTSRIRCVRKWLTENVLPTRKTVCIIAVDGKREGERLWKYVEDKPQPVAIQTAMF